MERYDSMFNINLLFLFFFFQAEDGIRDYKVTGVQTSALPISSSWISTYASAHVRMLLATVAAHEAIRSPKSERLGSSPYGRRTAPSGARRGVSALVASTIRQYATCCSRPSIPVRWHAAPAISSSSASRSLL